MQAANAVECSSQFTTFNHFNQLSDLVPASQANICCLWIVRTPYNNNTQTMNTRTWRPTRRSDCMVGLVNRLVLSQEWKHASLVICLTWQLCYSKSAIFLSMRKENIQILNWVRFWKQQIYIYSSTNTQMQMNLFIVNLCHMVITKKSCSIG